MRGFLKKTAAGLVAALIAFSCLFVQAFAEESKTEASKPEDTGTVNDGQMNLDVVFVLDASGSMTKSDPKKLAIDAYRLFVDLLDDTCGIGYVVFTHELKEVGEVVNTSDKAALEETKTKMASIKYDYQGYTDIALGLTKAKDLLIDQSLSKNHRDKLIILLTDGNTALPEGGRSLEDSNDEMDATLMELHDRQIPVHSIGLNYNGKMKKEELQHIADETEGTWKETSTSDELLEVFSGIFQSVNQVTGEEKKIEDGNVGFEITDSSVFNVNFIIQTPFTLAELNPILTNPSGSIVPLENNEDVSVLATGSYLMLKLFYPEEGKWNLHLDKATNQNTTVTQMDYYSLYIEQVLKEQLSTGEVVNVKDYLASGGELVIEAVVKSSEGIVTDQNLLNTLEVVARVAKENGDTTLLPMVPQTEAGHFLVQAGLTDLGLSEGGSIDVAALAKTTKFKKDADTARLSIVTREVFDEKQKLRLGDGYMGDQTYSIPEDSGNAGFTVMILIIAAGMVVGVIVLVVIIRRRIPEKALGGEVKFEEPVPEKEAPKQPFVPEKPIVMPEAKDPDLVNYELIEHDAIENLIKKGPEEAFAANPDDYKTDEALEAIVKKGPDTTFAVGTDKLPEEEDEYDEYGEDDGYEDHGLDDQYDDDDDDDNYGGMGGYDPNDGYGNMGGYDPNAGYGNMGGYDPNAGYGNMGGYNPNAGYGNMGGYDPNAGYGNMGGYNPNAGYGNMGGYNPNEGYGNMGGYNPNEGYVDPSVFNQNNGQ